MRYAFSGGVMISKKMTFDVVIIGAGIAGLYAALNMDSDRSCCVITKENVEISNSWLAQGGIAAAISDKDNPHLHLQDTLVAGAGLCDEAAVRTLVEEGPGDVRRLVDMGVPFDLNDEGNLSITREGGHHMNRIVHAGGDATGRETAKVLARLCAGRQGVYFMAHTFLVDILTNDDGSVSGVLVASRDQGCCLISTANVILATGGIGQVYMTSTNPDVATGDGLAAAVRAGAKLKGMEFIQFHPTGLWSPKKEDRAFLISEAVRGEGGLLKNKAGERFMLGKHELNELAPRDIVARAIVCEMARTGDDHVFVDITAKDGEFLAHRFPTIYHECMSRGIDISKDWIPVCPVQHYLIGGIAADLHSATGVPGLYACGEAAYTGVHGANRLASNSMLECLVFGRRAAEHINERLRNAVPQKEAVLPSLSEKPEPDTDMQQLRTEIRRLMNDYGCVIRTKAGMEKALARIEEMLTQLEAHALPDRISVENYNIATIAKSILVSALARKESVGAHYRED